MSAWPRRLRRVGQTLAAPDASLLAKLLGAFVAVLALASLVTLLLETRITREQLRAQAYQTADQQGRALDLLYRQERDTIVQMLRTSTQNLAISGRSLERNALDILSFLGRSTALSLGAVFDADGQIVTALPRATADIVPPAPVRPDHHLDDYARSRVVPLSDGSYAVLYTVPLQLTGDRPLYLAVGYPLDWQRARQLADRTQADGLEIVVDGEVVASLGRGASADGSTPLADWRVPGEVQPVEGGRQLVRYVSIARAGSWSHDASIGLIVDDPLSPLDAQLTRTRALMVALLILLAAALAAALARVIVRPVTRLTETAAAIAGGDLDASFEVDRRDEVGQLADALERMRRGLRSQLLVIQQQTAALREAARRMVGVQDAERRRLAQDLHDGIQQQLVVLRMRVGFARSQIREDPRRIDEIANGLAAAIDRILDDLRATGQALFPSILQDRGLSGAVFSLASRAEIPVDVALEPDPLPRLDPDVETNAYFLLSEAVTNALKHARASRLSIMLRHEGDALRVRVADDGQGYDPGRLGHAGGLIHMRDRVNAMGGSLQIVTAAGEGTTVTALFPLSVPGALEVEKHGGDAPVEVGLLRQSELAEDGVGVLLDGPVSDGQVAGDRGVSLPRRHE